MSKKRIFILWSGGADSTYTIQRCMESDDYDLVIAGYVAIKNNAAKVEYELDAISKMLPLLIDTWNGDLQKFVWDGVIAEVRLKHPNKNVRYKQQALWAYLLMAAVSHADVDEVALGINGSEQDLTLPASDFQQTLDGFRPLLRDDPPKCVYPIRDLLREELIERLRPDLRELCVYCEDPVKEAGAWRKCGICPPCKKYG